jgi:hypothetical protein
VDIFDQAKARSDCREVVLGLTTLNKSNQGPCPVCGTGDDRFYLHRGGERCGCRKCEFQGDQIDLLAEVQGISRVQAAEHLAKVSAKSLPRSSRALTPQKRVRTKIIREWHSDSWQSDARLIIEPSESRLQLEGYHDQFLWQSRRLGLATARQFRLGYDPEVFDPATKSKRPAIVIPWLDRSGIITAIKYRFIDDLAQDKRRRFFQKKGSESLLFGLNACSKDSKPRGIVIVEGEFNAMAIVQAVWFCETGRHDYGPDGVGGKVIVLSVGSQGNSKGLEMARKYCEKYPGVNVMLWFDEEKQVKEAFKVFPKGIGVKSIDGLDANDILKTYGHHGLDHYVLSRLPKEARVHKEEVFI